MHLVKLNVNTPHALAYSPITPPELQCCLKGKNPLDLQNTSIVAIGAEQNGNPIGLAIATVAKYTGEVDVLYLFVLPQYRSSHLGRKLLEKLENEAGEEGGRILNMIFSPDDAGVPALEKVLTARRWAEIRPLLIRCRYNMLTLNIPWVMNSNLEYPPGYEMFPWVELSKDERTQLLKDEKNRRFAVFVSPFREEEQLEPLNSLGLRFNGMVVGWMVTHHSAPDTVRYTSMYMEPGLRHRGLLMAKLLVDSIHLHLEARHQYPKAVLEIPLHHAPASWINFFNRRLLPYADEVERLSQAWKYISLSI